MSGQVAENGPAELCIEDSKIAAVPDILGESPQVGGQGLVSIILGIIDGHRFIEGGIYGLEEVDPVIHTSQVIDQRTSSKRGTGCKPVGPDQGPVDPDIMPEVTPDDEKIRFGCIDLPVGFSEYFPAHSAVKVGSQFPGIIKDHFTLQSSPYL